MYVFIEKKEHEGHSGPKSLTWLASEARIFKLFY